MTSSFSFHGVSRPVFRQLEKMVEFGLQAKKEKDTFCYEGITVRYAYDAGNQDLKFDILDRSTVVTDAYVMHWISKSIASLGKQ